MKGIAPAGAFNINNSCVIVATALKEFFVNGTPVEDTINSCDDIFQFQIIAKAGAKYREAYHVVDGEKQSVQKVNRVYATADERYGKNLQGESRGRFRSENRFSPGTLYHRQR